MVVALHHLHSVSAGGHFHHGEMGVQHISALDGLPSHSWGSIDLPGHVPGDQTIGNRRALPEDAQQVHPPGVW